MSLHPVLLLAGILLMLRPAAVGHPLHASTGEAHYQEETQRLEVSIAVFTSDLETALSARAKHRVSLTQTPAALLDPLILASLRETFVVKNRAGALQPLVWVGRAFEKRETSPPDSPSPSPVKPDAVDDSRTLLFFEIPLPEGVQGISLKYNLLTDLFPDQKNTISIHHGKHRVTLAFSPSSLGKPVVFPP